MAPYSFLDRQDKEERLSFNTLVGRHLRDITLSIGLTELVFAFLAFIDRLNPTVPSTVYFVNVLANDSFWAGAFMITAVLVIVSMKIPELRSIGMSISSACCLIWGVVVFFQAATAQMPVALSVGIAAVSLGVVAYKVCLAWNVIHFKQKFGVEDVERVTTEVK